MKCKDCAYYLTLPGPRDSGEQEMGQCHLVPPVVVVEQGIGPEVVWPLVLHDDFCGQYKTKV